MAPPKWITRVLMLASVMQVNAKSAYSDSSSSRTVGVRGRSGGARVAARENIPKRNRAHGEI